MKKLIYISIPFLLIAGIIIWFNFDWLKKIVLAAGNDSNTVSLLHMNGTDGSTTFTDSAAGGTHTWTANGDAQIDTAQSKFGGASGLFDGTGDYLSTPDSNDWNFGSGDFTIDTWVRFNSTAGNQAFYSQGIDGNNYILLYFQSNVIGFQLYDAGVDKGNHTYSWTPSTGVWYHVALVRNGSNLYLFIDGTNTNWTGTSISSNSVPDFASDPHIGTDIGHTWGFNGWLDETRISKGIARWTANFTPPTCEYNGACVSPPIKVPDVMIFE